MIVPDGMVEAVEKIASSLAICAPTLAPARRAGLLHDALKTFARRGAKQRRDYLPPEFERLGLRVPVKPDGAFYIYADISDLGMDSAAFATPAAGSGRRGRAGPGLRSGPRRPHHALLLCHRPGPPGSGRRSHGQAAGSPNRRSGSMSNAPLGRVFLWPGATGSGSIPGQRDARCQPGAGARPAPWRHNRCRRGRLRRHNRPVRHRPSRAG